MSYAEKITNHTRITVTSKKTGTTAVLLETNPSKPDFKDPNVGSFVEAGVPITECIDDSLDNFTFTVREYPTRKLFEKFDIVTFTVDDGLKKTEYEMCVLSDHATMLSRFNRLYTHVVTCIESTKLLEKVKIFNMNLTNPHDTLLDQFEKALTNAEPVLKSTQRESGNVYFERKCRFAISERLRAFLTGKSGEDFYSGNTDLRAVLDNMLVRLNARVCVDHIEFGEDHNIAKIELGYRSMTATKDVVPQWTFEENGEIVGEEFENNGQDAAGKIVARGFNTLTPEPITFTDVFKSDSATVNDTTASIFLPFPIGDRGIEKLTVRVKLEVKKTGIMGTSTHLAYDSVDVDITSHLIPYEQFQLLSKKDKNDFIPYEIGGTSIGVGQYLVEKFSFTDSSIHLILKEEGHAQWDGFLLKKYEDRPGFMHEIGDDIIGKWYNYVFHITYFPQADTAIELSKPNIYDKDELLLGAQDSQSENTLDVQRHGRRLEGLIKRTGNDEYYLDVKARYFSKLLPLMTKMPLPLDGAGHTDDDYVIYKREGAVYDGFVKCRYYFSKDFNAVQEYAGIVREKHLFDIPLESDECPLMIKQYLVFGFERGNALGIFYDDSVIASALGTIIGINEGKTFLLSDLREDDAVVTFRTHTTGKINYLLFQSSRGPVWGSSLIDMFPYNTEDHNGDTPYHADNYWFARPCLTYGQAKTMNFIARPLDNYSVDYSRDGYAFSVWGDKGNMITYNRYVDNAERYAGECDRFTLCLAFECKAFIFPELYEDFPDYDGSDGNALEDYERVVNRFPVVKEEHFVGAQNHPFELMYNKDRTQKPVFCASIECVPTQKDYGNLIIGSAFCRDNNLVHENGSGLTGLRLVVSAEKTIDDDADWIPEGYEEAGDPSEYFSVGKGQLNYKGGISGLVRSWAIVNASGEIYIAANGAPRTVYAWFMDFPE